MVLLILAPDQQKNEHFIQALSGQMKMLNYRKDQLYSQEEIKDSE